MTREAEYFAPTWFDPWRWQERDSVLVWRDGRTVAFRPQIAELLRRIAPGGLPDFSVIAWTCAALRGGEWWRLDGERELPDGVAEEWRDRFRAIAALPAELRSSPETRSSIEGQGALLEVFVEGLDRPWRGAIANSIVTYLESEGEIAGERTDLAADDTPPAWTTQPAPTISPERLRLRIEAGLDTLPDSLELDIDWGSAVGELVRELEKSESTRPLARLIHEARVIATIPRPLAEPDLHGTGGNSDLVPRGPLDRLLLSELAQDPDTLATRVALGEALYLRREAPPSPRAHPRTIVVDVGVRQWGRARVVASALALALASGDRGAGVRVYTAGSELRRSEIHHLDGWIEHLGRLEPTLDLRSVLPALPLVASSDEDVVVIVSERTLDDSEFRRAWRAVGGLLIVVGAPSIEEEEKGARCRVRLFHGRALRRGREANLDVSGVVDLPEAEGTRFADLRYVPASLRPSLFPLRLPVVARPDRIATVAGEGGVALSADGRLSEWSGHESYARQRATDFPTGAILAIDAANSPGHVDAVVRGEGGASLVRVERDSGAVEVIPLPVPRHVTAAVLTAHSIFIGARIGDREVGAVVIVCLRVDGRFVESIVHRELLPGGTVPWLTDCQRLIERLPDRAGGGAAIPYPGVPDYVVRGAVGVIDTFEDGAPRFVTPNGIWPDWPRGWAYPRPRRSVRAQLAADRRHVLFFDDDDRVREAALPQELREKLTPAEPIPKTNNLRTRWRAIAVDAAGQVWLLSRRRRAFVIGLSAEGLWLVPRSDAEIPDLIWREPLERVGVPPGGLTLSVVTWPTRAWAAFDPRGLLHLAPPSGVEVTIALSDRQLAAWDSDGRVAGPPQMIPGRRSEPGTLAASIENFAREARS